ncbi:MAG: MAG5620 family putative phospho-sugar mutase [Metamycoplasmataceae bacterium]
MKLKAEQWINFFKNNKEKSSLLNRVFSNLVKYEDYFLSLPMYQNHHIIFNKKYGFANFNEYSASWLAQALNEIVFQNESQKIFISIENEKFNFKSLNHFKDKLSLIEHQIYQFNNSNISNFNFAYYASKKMNMDYLIHFNYYEKEDAVDILIYNFKRGFDNFLLDIKIKELFEYLENNDLNNLDYKENKTLPIDYDFYLDEYTSNNHLLKAFRNIKQRYKTTNLINSKNIHCLNETEFLLNRYNKQFLKNYIKEKNIHYLYKNKLIGNLFYRNKKINNIFNFDSNNNLTVITRLKEKYLYLNNHNLSLIYLDFFLQELKIDGEMNLNNFFVVLPVNAPKTLKILLNRYKVNIKYENDDLDQLIKNPNCLFYYNENRFIPNPRFFFYYDNYYFLVCLIWMFNSLLNRNNLLTYKWEQLKDNLGEIIFKNKEVKIKKLKNDWLDILKKNDLKKNDFSLEIINFKNDLFHYLFKIKTNNNHQVIVKKNNFNNQIIIEYQLITEYHETINNIFFDYLKIKKIIKKLIKTIDKK